MKLLLYIFGRIYLIFYIIYIFYIIKQDVYIFLWIIYQECTLKQIMDHEAEIIKNTQALHSDMQTLVYENYNKFISATDTIRKVNYLLKNN